MNLSVKVSFWSKLMEIFLQLADSYESRETAPFLLFNGGSFNLNVGSYDDLPGEVKELAMGMLNSMQVIPPA
jgi:hypothetical protein